MRLMLPFSDSQQQALAQEAAFALTLGRLHAVREQAMPDGSLSVSAKFSDSFGFVDHPRLTAVQGKLADFRCDCTVFRQERRFCPHCMALAQQVFTEICTEPAQVIPEETPEPPETPETSAILPFFRAAPPLPPPVERISYAFCNSGRDLYPGKINPRIPLVRYYQMFGKNARARMLYSRKTRWGGSCFGMTATASMFFVPEDPVTAPDFRVDAVYPADLLLTSRSKQLHMTLHTFIEGMHILQFHDLCVRATNEHLLMPDCMDEICRRVLHFQQTKTEPVGMSVWRSPRFDGGHSVFPFWLEQSENGEDRLHIYDPNHPMTTRYAYLEKGENGHYTNWRFPMFNDVEYSSATGGQLSFDAYSDYKQVWDQRGGEQDDAMMSVPRSVAICSTDGEVLFRVTETGTESFCDNIYQILLTDMAEDEDEQVLLTLPAGRYLVRNEDPQRETLRVQFSHNAQAITVSTNAPELEITADDRPMCVCVCIAYARCSYAIELDAIYEEDSHIILLEGITAEDGLRFGCYNGVLRVMGTLNEELASLYIDEELADLSCIEQERVQAPQHEPSSQKKHILITSAAQPDDASSADATD